MLSNSEYAAAYCQDYDGIHIDETSEMSVGSAAKECLEGMLKEGWNEIKETTAKKLMVAAGAIAKKHGVETPEAFNKGAIGLAFAVDEAIDLVKGGFKVANGEMTASEMLEIKAKKGIARTEVALNGVIDNVADVAKKMVDKEAGDLLAKGINCVVAAISSQYPQVALIQPFVAPLAKILTKPVKKVVNTGIDLLAKGAKSIVARLADSGRSLLTRMTEKVSSWLAK